ncbi:phosphoglucosamine mutase, partial [Chlamydiales bacterium]|nr:phosphoglucosamine mutase [Chlamydiales bacterium]
IFKELDADVFIYGNEPNGFNINDGVGALFPQTTQKGVIDAKADVGIALDGDGDRVIMVDEHAQIIDGDTLLAICARDLDERGLLKNKRVISTVMANIGFIKTMDSLGIDVIQTGVGDRHVIQGMLEHDSNLGGEQSGHTIFLDYNTTGDGLVTALQVLRIMIEKESTLSDLASFVQHYPQTTMNIPVSKKPPLEELSLTQKAIKEVEKKLGDSGRVLVRYSGTENICRVMIEGPKLKQVVALAEKIAEAVREEIGK